MTEKVTYSYWLFFWAHPGMSQNCYMPKLGWVIPNCFQKPLLAQKRRQSLLLGTPIFIDKHINLVANQAMQADENECLVI